MASVRRRAHAAPTLPRNLSIDGIEVMLGGPSTVSGAVDLNDVMLRTHRTQIGGIIGRGVQLCRTACLLFGSPRRLSPWLCVWRARKYPTCARGHCHFRSMTVGHDEDASMCRNASAPGARAAWAPPLIRKGSRAYGMLRLVRDFFSSASNPQAEGARRHRAFAFVQPSASHRRLASCAVTELDFAWPHRCKTKR